MNERSLTAIGLSLQQYFQDWLNCLTQGWLADDQLEGSIQLLQAIDSDLDHIHQLETGLIDIEVWLTAGLSAPDLASILPQPMVAAGAIEPSSIALQPSSNLHQFSDRVANDSFSAPQLFEHHNHSVVTTSHTDHIDASEKLSENPQINYSPSHSSTQGGFQPAKAKGVKQAIFQQENILDTDRFPQNWGVKRTVIDRTSHYSLNPKPAIAEEEAIQKLKTASKPVHFIEGRSLDQASNSFGSINQKAVSLASDFSLFAPPQKVILSANPSTPISSQSQPAHAISSNHTQGSEPETHQRSNHPPSSTKGLKDLAQLLQSDRIATAELYAEIEPPEQGKLNPVEKVMNSEVRSSQTQFWNHSKTHLDLASSDSNKADLSPPVTQFSLNNSTAEYDSITDETHGVVEKSDRVLRLNSTLKTSDKTSNISLISHLNQDEKTTPQTLNATDAEELNLEIILDAVQEQINREYRRFYGS